MCKFAWLVKGVDADGIDFLDSEICMMYDFCTILAYLFVSMSISPAKGNFSRLVSTSVHFRSVSPYHLECQLPVVGDNPSSIFNINEYSRLWMMFNYMYFTSRLPFFRVTFIQQTLCHCYLLYHPTFLRIYWPSLVNSWKFCRSSVACVLGEYIFRTYTVGRSRINTIIRKQPGCRHIRRQQFPDCIQQVRIC